MPRDIEKQRKAQREWARKNREINLHKVKGNATKYRIRIREEVNNFKTKNPCADCNERYPAYVMDFDHRPEEVKLFTIGANVVCVSRERLWKEIAKCDIVCSNCHRIRTYG